MDLLEYKSTIRGKDGNLILNVLENFTRVPYGKTCRASRPPGGEVKSFLCKNR